MVVDGIELLRLIRDKKIKAWTKIKWGQQNLCFDGDNIVYEDSNQKLLSILWDLNFANAEFEILSEEDEEIDIQSIEEFKIEYETDINPITGSVSVKLKDINEKNVIEKINEIIKAIKHLDKKIK